MIDGLILLPEDFLMTQSPNNDDGHEELNEEQVKGVRVGIAILAVFSICLLVLLIFPVFCPQWADKIEGAARQMMSMGAEDH